MSYTDAIGRIAQIQSQIASLSGAFSPASATAPAASGGVAGTGAVTNPTYSSYAPGAASGSSFAAQLAAASDAGGALPAGAQSRLTGTQQQFASRLATDTGLDPGVVSAWLLAEENGGAAQAREAAGNNDWLNIGYTDSGTFGSSDSIWSNPVMAADATAGWLKGQNTIPGYGAASTSVQAILATAGQAPSAQISALQQSGWASSGYPDLPALYSSVAGG